MDTPTKFYPFVTVDDLEAMPDDGNRYEVIEGELLHLTPTSFKERVPDHEGVELWRAIREANVAQDSDVLVVMGSTSKATIPLIR